MTPNQNLKEKLELYKLKRADSASYIKYLCIKIVERTQNIELPSLLPEEVEYLQKIIHNYEPLPEKDVLTTIINLHDAFKIISKIEQDTPMAKKISPIIQFLSILEPIIIEIQDPRNKPLLEIVKRQLHLPLNLFQGLYHHVVDQSSPPQTEYTNLLSEEESEEKE
jgi:hypothetical protein